jgi:hypothetical protein
MTRNEQWGRLWLALFSLLLSASCVYGLVLSASKAATTGQISLSKDLLMPVGELLMLVFLWTGEPWIRWLAILSYALRGAPYLLFVVTVVTAMHAATPPEQAAAGRTAFLVLLPGLAAFLLLGLRDWGMCALLAFVPSVRAFLNHQRYAGQGLWDALRNWWKFRDCAPQVRDQQIGELGIRCGALLIADPMYVSAPVRVGGLPEGRFPIVAQIIEYPEGGQRVARIAIKFRSGRVTKRESLGQVGVDSATVIVLDEQTYRDYWREVGPERVGMTFSPNDNRKVAALIGKKFRLQWRPLNGFQSMFLEPVSEDLEQDITEYLQTMPEYADYPFMYFRIETNNTLDRIQEAMTDTSWAEVVLKEDDGESESVIAFASGFGDGSYDLIGVYGGDNLLAIEITFIGPDQDKILEGFPFLRDPPYSGNVDDPDGNAAS